MTSGIALYSGNIVIYWSAVIIALGILAALFMGVSLRRTDGENTAAMFLLVPIAVLFSVPICRFIDWYCLSEQYLSFRDAMTNYAHGNYVLPGALLGTFIAALIVKAVGFTDSVGKLLDAFAPPAALCVSFIRLSALFNSSCRSKASVEIPFLQRLPFAVPYTSPAGTTDYRVAVFFIQFLVMAVFTLLLLKLFYTRRNIPMVSGSRRGNIARLFLLFHSAGELLLDSMRFDSSYMHFNGFVSIVQMISALSILGLLIYYSVHSVRANGRTSRHWVMWIGWFFALAGTGVSEYMVQRHGNWFAYCYLSMTVCVFFMAFIVWRMYLSCGRRS